MSNKGKIEILDYIDQSNKSYILGLYQGENTHSFQSPNLKVLLTNIGGYNVINGCHVIHINLEGDRNQCINKYVSIFLDCPFKDFLDIKKAKLDIFKNKNNYSLQVLNFVNFDTSVEDILRPIKNEIKKRKIVIIDKPELLKEDMPIFLEAIKKVSKKFNISFVLSIKNLNKIKDLECFDFLIENNSEGLVSKNGFEKELKYSTSDWIFKSRFSLRVFRDFTWDLNQKRKENFIEKCHEKQS